MIHSISRSFPVPHSACQLASPPPPRFQAPRHVHTQLRPLGNHVCSIWQLCASDSGNKIAVSAHGMREVQTLASVVSRLADWRDGCDVMLRNILPQIDPTLKGARRRSTASARSEAEPRTRTTARTLVSAAMRSRPSRSVEGQPWVPDGSTVGPRFLGGNRGFPHKNRQPWVPATSFLFCVRWIATSFRPRP